MNILIGDEESIHSETKAVVDRLNLPGNNQIFWESAGLTDDQLTAIDIIVGNTEAELARIFELPNTKLRWIQAISAGVDYYPLQKLAANHIQLTNASGIHAEPISETVIGMILDHYRGIATAIKRQTANKWDRSNLPISTVTNRTIAIFGTGHIGSQIAEYAKAFKLQTIGINHNGHPADYFDQTVSQKKSLNSVKTAAIIVNTMPLTPKTTGFFNTAFFDQLSSQPLLINIGRGKSVTTTDLIAALNDHQLSGAALDVTEPEPLAQTSPLWSMPNVIITPHISGIYDNYMKDALAIFKKNLTQFEQDGNLPVNQVDLSAGY